MQYPSWNAQPAKKIVQRRTNYPPWLGQPKLTAIRPIQYPSWNAQPNTEIVIRNTKTPEDTNCMLRTHDRMGRNNRRMV